MDKKLKEDRAIENSLSKAVMHFQNGEFSECIRACEQITRFDSANFDAISLQGLAASQSGQLASAESLFLQALQVQPDSVEILNALGHVLKAQCQFQRAYNCFFSALKLRPNAEEELVNVASVLVETGHLGEAADYCRIALTRSPELSMAQALLNQIECISSASKAGGDNAKSLDAIVEPAISDSPDDWIRVLEQGGSVAGISKELDISERSVVLAVANRLFGLGEAEKAVPILESYLELHSDHVLQMALLRNLISVGHEDKPKIQHAVSQLQLSFKQQLHDLPVFDHSHHNLQKDRPLRLGFVCTYSNLSPVKFSLVPMFRAMNRSEFHLTFFSLGQEGTPLLDEVCDEHFVLKDIHAQTICNEIARRKIDILFDLNGLLREDFPYEVFAMQPAPVQAGWWNTPVSCGMETVRYYFMDRTMLTTAHDDMFTERIVGIPGGATLCYELPDTYPLSPSPHATNEIFTFGSFTALFKINDAVLRAWARILLASPDSRMIIKSADTDSSRFINRINTVCEELGLDRDRFLLKGLESFDDMMPRFADIDLCLNTFSYGAGTTALNAIWQGVPTLAFAGNLPHARGTASMMNDCGMGEFVASDLEDYIQKAVHFSQNPQRLSELRPTLRSHVRQNSTWLNPTRFARNFEQACRNAWIDWIDSK